MMKTSQVSSKQRKSSSTRNANRPWGYQKTSFNSKSKERIKKAVEAGVLPKSALSVTMTIKGRKKK